MSFFKQPHRTPPKEIRVSALCFIGEQDGPSERILKTRLVNFFTRDKSIKRAYLAKIGFDNAGISGVALCLKTEFGTDKGMVEKIGTVFASVFNTKEHLDIIFLTDEQETSLAKVCNPFYV